MLLLVHSNLPLSPPHSSFQRPVASSSPVGHVSLHLPCCYIFRGVQFHILIIYLVPDMLLMSVLHWPFYFSCISCISLHSHNLFNVCNPKMLKYWCLGVSYKIMFGRLPVCIHLWHIWSTTWIYHLFFFFLSFLSFFSFMKLNPPVLLQLYLLCHQHFISNPINFYLLCSYFSCSMRMTGKWNRISWSELTSWPENIYIYIFFLI